MVNVMLSLRLDIRSFTHTNADSIYYKSSIGFDRYNSIDSNSINLITYLEISNAGNRNRN